MARRTKAQALATRSLILDTAERLFEERGVSGTSLHDIAQAAGLTRGAIYWHFADKADLFNAMMERVTLPMEEGLHAAAPRTRPSAAEDPLDALRTSFVEALRRTAEDPQARRVFEIAIHKVEYVGELQAVRERRRAIRDECLADIGRGLTRAVRQGRLGRRVPVRIAALGLQAMIEGLIQHWMLDPDAFDLVRAGTQILDSYLAGLAPAIAGAPAVAAPKRPSVSARRLAAASRRRRVPP